MKLLAAIIAAAIVIAVGATIGISKVIDTPANHGCASVSNRPLRVGITHWAGFSGGLVRNGGFVPSENTLPQWNLPQGVEFVAVDGFEKRQLMLSDNSEDCVDVLWSSVESWAAEFPRWAEDGVHSVHARAIMQIAQSHGGHLVTDPDIGNLADIKAPSRLNIARFTAGHWLAEQNVIRKDLLYPVDSAKIALDGLSSRRAAGVIISEPEMCLAQGNLVDRKLINIDKNNNVAYVLLARQEVIDKAPDLLKQFVKNWLDGNQKAESHHDLVDELLAKEFGECKGSNADNELSHLNLSNLQDNSRFFGLDGGAPIFDEMFNTAGYYWESRNLINRSEANAAKDDRFIRDLVAQKPSLPAIESLCEANQKITTKETATILFDPPGSTLVRDIYKPALDHIAATAKSQNTLQVCIEGHTDSTGRESKNETLSKERAQAVFNYLRDNGRVAANKMVPRGKGASDPAPQGDTPEALLRNRRTIIRVVTEENQ